jgi:hypothetical protein
MPAQKAFNPFYPLLVIAGVGFAITACAYGVMTVKMLQPAGAAEVRQAGGGLLFFMDQHGLTLLLSELGALAVLTVAAIGTDDFWTRRAQEKVGMPDAETTALSNREFAFTSEELPGGRTLRYQITRDGTTLRSRDVLDLWQRDAEFRNFFLRTLADAPYEAFRWETPPLARDTLDEPFEFVLLDSPELDRRVDREAFAEHFGSVSGPSVVSFANLGGDAVLVVPCPRGPDSTYGHLAAFVRNAPLEQKHLLWQRVAEAMESRLSDRPVWLSTAGAGVSWLHVRLDDRPKYYQHRPYRASS